MKNKKLLICALSLCFMAVAAFTACNNGAGVHSDSSVATETAIDIKEETAQLIVFGESTLTVTGAQSSDIVWSSSNPEVATVENGVVIGKNIGTATITATANGFSDSCVVEVVSSQAMPVIQLNKTEITLGVDTEYTIKASVYWNNKDVTEAISLSWALGAYAKEGIASISQSTGNSVVFKGVSIGKTEFYVSTTIGDVYVNEKISVTVNDASVAFDIPDLVCADNGNFALSMLTINESGEANEIDCPTIYVYEDGEKSVGEGFVWYSENEDVLQIADGKMIAKSTGVADVYATNEKGTVKVSVTVERYFTALETVYNFEIADLKPAETDIPSSVTGEVLLDGAIVGVCENGVIVLDAALLPSTVERLGVKQLTIYTNLATYALTANIVTRVIDEASDLAYLATPSTATANLEGYFVLTNDIDASGVKCASGPYTWNYGFKGVFEGNNHTIKNLTVGQGGIFGQIYGGTVQNVSFKNLAIDDHSNYVAVFGGISQYWTTIQNVNITFGKVNFSEEEVYDIGIVFSRLMTQTTLRDVTIDATGWTIPCLFGSQFVYGDEYDSSCTFKNVTVKAEAVNKIGETSFGKEKTESSAVTDWPTGVTYTQAEALRVNFPTLSSYYTLDGGPYIIAGEDYSFSITAKIEGCDEFAVFVNGTEVFSDNGVYTVENVTEDLTIDVVHGYVEAYGTYATVAYSDGDIIITDAVFAADSTRLHGDAYISAEYIEYMIAQGYTKLSFNYVADGEIATQAVARYNGAIVAYVITQEVTTITIDLVAGANSDLEFWAQNSAGSGLGIMNQGSKLYITDLTFFA